MANLNLSEFTEKLFVADADHTFIWDTAASISKRVSRNSWLNSGELTSSAPVTISQTWNAGSNVMTALKVVATDTVSGTTSNLLSLDLSTNNVLGEKWRFKFEKGGLLKTTGNIELGIGLAVSSALLMGNGFYAVGGGNGLYMGGGVGGYILNHGATQLWRGSADHILEQRNSSNPQTFRVYNTYTDANNYERGIISWESNELNIRSEKAGSGQFRNIIINAAAGLKVFLSNSTLGFQYTTAGHLLYNNDNLNDIGASGANRPRNVYVGSDVIASNNVGAGAAGYLNWFGRSIMGSPSNGVISLLNNAGTDFNRLQFGGTTNLFPSIKRNGAGLDIVLANDSGFAAVQDLYRRFGAGTPEGVVTAPIGAVYHNTTGGAGTSFYVKESGTGNTGWVGK